MRQILSLPQKRIRDAAAEGNQESSYLGVNKRSHNILPPFQSHIDLNGRDLLPHFEMEQEGMMESLEFDEHGIPTVFYLNVDGLDGDVHSQTSRGHQNGDQETHLGLGDDGVEVGDVGVRLIKAEEEEEPFTHHYSLQEDGTIHYHQGGGGGGRRSSSTHNGIYDPNTVHLGDGLEQENNFEFEDVTTMPVNNATSSSSTGGGDSADLNLNHFQLRLQPSSTSSSITFPFTVTTTTPNHIPTASSSSSATTNGGFLLQNPLTPGHSPSPLHFHAQTPGQKRKMSPISTPSRSLSLGGTGDPAHPPSPPPQKRPKLLVNLYEAEVGYEFGALLRDHVTPSQISNLIPYSEDYLLRALDREEIPTKVISHLSPVLRWRRGHLLAQIRDYRRFSSATQVVPGKGGGGGKGQRSNPHQYRVLKRSNPVITELVLRPNTASRLADFEALLASCSRPGGRGYWKRAKIGSNASTNSGLSKGKQPQQPRSRPISSEDEDSEVLDDSDVEIELEEGGGGVEGREERGRLSYEQRLELEKEFINKSSGPLCLDPSPRVAIIQNRIQFERLKWRCPSLIQRPPSPSALLNPSGFLRSDSSTSAPATAASFSAFVTRLKERNKEKERTSGSSLTPKDHNHDPLKVLSPYELPFVEYPPLEPPSSMEEILRLGPTPEPTTLRPLPIDNFIKRIEEYTLETERRKRPHTTKLSIFQRNGMDAYFGELEMESIQEGGGGASPKPGGQGQGVNQLTSSSTKCQFELGSSQSVALYVKQFSDIFTEDGRRPCKITYQKVGQPAPQVLYTNSYKTAGAAGTVASTTTPTTPTASTATPAPGVVAQVAPQPLPQSQPPVQIVHPQPRSAQIQLNNESSNPSPRSAQSPQILTRPLQGQGQGQQQIIGISQPQPQQQAVTASQLVQAQKPQQSQGSGQGQGLLGPTNVPTASASHQQLLQQRLLRLKQVQAQQAAAAAAQQSQSQPPHQTALAKLLMTNMNNSATPISRPITVAVQPQPQKTAVTSEGQLHQSNVNLNLNTGSGQQGHLSVNLNTMVLDGLLSQNQAAQLRAHGQIQLQGQGQGQIQGGGGHSSVNILRGNQQHQVVVSSGGTIIGGSNRYTTTSNTGFTTLLQGGGQGQGQGGHLTHQLHHGGQRILINANNGQQLTLSSSSPSHSTSSNEQIMEEISVPDLNSLLANVSSSSGHGQGQLHGQGQGSHQILTSGQQLHLEPSTQSHNLNLNLNLNLNSGGGSCGLGLDALNHGPHGTNTPPPFLVFISPLRSVPVSINTASSNVGGGGGGGVRNTSLLAQQLNAGPQGQQGQGQQQLSLSLDGNVVTSSDQGQGGGGGLEPGEYYTMGDGGLGGGTEIKLEPLEHNPTPGSMSTSMSTVMIGNTAYSLNVSSSSGYGSGGGGGGGGGGGDSKKDVITLSSLLGSSKQPTTSSSGGGGGVNLPPLILQQQGGHSKGHGGQGGIVVSSPSSLLSSTPRLSALLAGTPSADSGSGSGGGGGGGLISPGGRGGLSIGGPGGTEASSRTLLDRLAASLSTNVTSGSSGGTVSSSGSGGPIGGTATSPPVMIRSGLNPIASATPNVVLDHPVLAATLTGQAQQGQGQPSPKLVSAYRQIAPAPTMTTTSPAPHGSRGKQP